MNWSSVSNPAIDGAHPCSAGARSGAARAAPAIAGAGAGAAYHRDGGTTLRSLGSAS
jgi:hypothetical protein